MEQLAGERLPDGFGFDWTDLAYQQKLAGNTGLLVFGASIVFVFLVLAAQYESWSLPLAVILIVPMCLLAAVSGLLLRGMDVNILAQVGFVVLVGLAAKNAILIVEFARQGEDEGNNRFDAAVQAARTRLRPILDDVFRVHPRRRPAGDRHRRRRRDAPVARHRSVFRHARRHRVWPHLHAGFLCRRARAVRRAKAAGNRRGSAVGENRRVAVRPRIFSAGTLLTLLPWPHPFDQPH